MNINDFDFSLPEHLIALEPLENRTSSRLVHVNEAGNIKDRNFVDIIDLIEPNDVLVFNNTKVIKARVSGEIEGRKAEITLLKKLPDEGNIWQVLAKPGKKFIPEKIFTIRENFTAKIIEKREDGTIILRFDCDEFQLFDRLNRYGKMPLPPYIEKKRKADDSDNERYQTVYAKKQGAVAAPTAGLHFNKDIIEKLKSKGVKVAEVTLHVGAGTFLPVRVDNIKTHKMHSEYYEIDEENAKIINSSKAKGGKVVAVGTTSLRALESSAFSNQVLSKCEETAIFIYPSYKFNIVDLLITNFHLPKSTLFMLISAFIGLDKAKELYQHAISEEYRFFSYGDSCFLEKNDMFSP